MPPSPLRPNSCCSFSGPLPTSYAHLYALKDRLMGTVAVWIPSGGGASRYLTPGTYACHNNTNENTSEHETNEAVDEFVRCGRLWRMSLWFPVVDHVNGQRRFAVGRWGDPASDVWLRIQLKSKACPTPPMCYCRPPCETCERLFSFVNIVQTNISAVRCRS